MVRAENGQHHAHSPQRATYLVAVHILLLLESRVLMLRRQNTGYADGLFSIVAGHVEHGETVIEAAIRETEEEAGVQITADDLCFELVLHRRGDDERVDFFFSSASWSGDIANAEPDKCAELRWCAPDALPDDTVPYIAHALSCWQEGIRFDTFGWDSRAQSPDDHAVIAQ